MHYFIYPSKDSTIYYQEPIQNTGLDEVLEVQKVFYPPAVSVTGSSNIREISRALIKWDLTDISQLISDNNIDTPRFYLNLSVCEAEELPFEYTIYVYPVSQSWDMGIGTRYDDITSDGVSWQYRDSNTEATAWVVSGSSYAAGTTGSSDGYGGSWYYGDGFEASQSFSYNTGDMRVDVTDIVHQWLSGSIDNDGFIIKHSFDVEFNTQDYGILKFFSMDTSTIYPPKLEMVWDDSSYVTGTLDELTHEDIVVYMKNLRSEYKEDSKIKFRVVARERIPAKTFSTSSQYVTVKYLPEGSFYYSVRDTGTKTEIIPFSDYTKISCDEDGPYFVIWLNGLQTERFYEIQYKVVRDETEEYFNNKFTFKLVR